MFASKSGNILVSLFNGVFAIGHFSLIWISNMLILFLAKFTLSSAPGASSFLCKDFATSISGDIITSIGKLELSYKLIYFWSRYSWDLILAIFFEILKIECEIWQISILTSSLLVTAIIISASLALAFSRTEGKVPIPTTPFTSIESFIFWISSLDWSIIVIEWFCADKDLAIVEPTLPAPQIIIFIN